MKIQRKMSTCCSRMIVNLLSSIIFWDEDLPIYHNEQEEVVDKELSEYTDRIDCALDPVDDGIEEYRFAIESEDEIEWGYFVSK
jgi:hypothetical protein